MQGRSDSRAMHRDITFAEHLRMSHEHMMQKYTQQQRRRMYIKRQHERFRLKKKYPEIDWDRPQRESERR